ncbi:MAG: patatin-like phospholipase family protein [Burkholderiaceae bacterium]
MFPRLAALLAVLLIAACSSFRPPVIPPTEDVSALPTGPTPVHQPVVVVVTLSGGGARASAFGLGVLRELKATKFDADGQGTTLLDQITLISGVSGGSLLAAHFAAFGEESLTRFETDFLLRDFQGRLIELALSPVRLFRLSSPWYGRSDVLAERLEELYRGRTFGDLRARRSGPDLLVTATDLTTGAPFEFTPEQFRLICADWASVPLSFAVAASSAVPLLLTPLTVPNKAGTCAGPVQAIPTGGDDNYRTRLMRSTVESYLHAEERPYIHLVDGGLADNLGMRTIMDRLIIEGSISAGFQRTAAGSIRKVVLIAVNSERGLVEDIDQSDRIPTSRQVVEALLFGAGARLTRTTLGMMEDDVQRWRREIEVVRGTPGSPFAADAELHLVTVSLGEVPDLEVRRSLLAVPTAFTIDADQVQELVKAGREVLRQAPEFQRLQRSLGQEPREGEHASAAYLGRLPSH